MVPIGNLFSVVRGNGKYTKSYCHQNPGSYPVYSASRGSAFGFISRFDYGGVYISIIRNGYAGFVEKLEGNFSINADRFIFIPKPHIQLPDLDFLKRTIQKHVRPLAIGRVVEGKKNEYTKITPTSVESVKIPLIVSCEGQYDFGEMERMGEIVRQNEKLKLMVSEKIQALSETDIVMDIGENYRTVEIGDQSLFEISIGKRVTYKEIKPEGIPTYSANVKKPIGLTDRRSVDYSHKPSLLWSIDSDFDWGFSPAGQEFFHTDHCGRLIIKDKVKIDPEYLFYELISTKEEYGFDRTFRANLENIKNVKARIPVTERGNFSLKKQRQIAEKYKQIYNISNNILEYMEEIKNTDFYPL